MARNVSARVNDDRGEMNTSRDFDGRQVDALLSGRAVADERLAPLVPAIAALRATATTVPSDAQVSSAASALAAAVPPAPAPVAHRAPWRRRILGGVSVAAALGIGFAGAAAADDAAPGDALYGLDRALEAVGVNAGGAEERLLEVRALVERGDVDGALEHAEGSMEDLDAAAAAGLRAAAAAVLDAGSEQSADVREQVAALLLWMSETDLEGEEFGRAVAEQARMIGRSDDAREEPGDGATGKPEGAGASATNQGAPEGAGAPESAPQGGANPANKPDTAGEPAVGTGSPDGAGAPDGGTPPAGSSKPDDAGEPSDAGAPDGAEKSDGAGKPDGAGQSDGARKPDEPSKPTGAGKPGS